MKKLTYKQIRKIIIEKCIAEKACGSENTPHDKEFGKLINAETESEFWQVIVANGQWSYEHGILNIELFERYGQEKMAQFGLFWTSVNETKITSFAWGNSQVTARGNSQVTAWENSQVTARENSQVTAR
ncbi:MAG: hypothetical protein V4549_07690, partial [Bacteroidota bacterium]